MTTTVQQHIEQRFTRKALHYLAGKRGTNPVDTAGGRMGMTRRRAQRLMDEVRADVAAAHSNIQAGSK
jgi:hypothetical protein